MILDCYLKIPDTTMFIGMLVQKYDSTLPVMV